MLYNYFQIALRNLLKHRIHTFINIFGLAFGIASVFLISLYIANELSYDKFHHQAGDLYRITWEDDNPQTRTPHPMAQALVNDFPEVESAVSLTPLYAAGLTRETHSVRHPDKQERYDESNILAVDSTFFDVFDFPVLRGDAKMALRKVNAVLISESIAKKYFGDGDPIGKHLAIDSSGYLVEVAAVFKDVPPNSHFHFDFLVSYIREKSFNPESPFYSWRDFGHYNYIRLRHGADAKSLEGKLLEWCGKYIDASPGDFASLVERNYGFRLQPVTDIHLKSRLHWELEANGNVEYIWILAAAAMFTLVIACVNFMNLTTAKSAERAKEIGVRKTMGALRTQLSFQFLMESVVIAVIAVLIAVLIIELSIPFFNYLTGGSYELQYWPYLAILLGGGVIIGAVSGAYPALYLSGIMPHLILKGKFVQSSRGSALRKSLIVTQFAISMILISASVIIYRQLNFLQHKNLGFNKEEVIIIPVKNEDGMYQFDAFRNELLKVEGVSMVSASSNIPGKQFNQHAVSLYDNPGHWINSSEAMVDYDFFKSLNINVIEGRGFMRENPADHEGYIINETAARQLHPSGSIVGKEIVWNMGADTVRGPVIGVVNDFHFQSLHDAIRPLCFTLSTRHFNYILIDVNTSDFAERIASIERVYSQFEPIYGFEFSFLEDQLNQQYSAEKRTGEILSIFSVIAVGIACFGLFGMAMLLFYQKIKEIGVRKVLGATPLSLLMFVLKDFTKLILVSIAIAIPITWYIMKGWLNNFSYQIEIQPLVFLLSGFVLVVLAWVTLSYFTVKAAHINPAEVLKNE